MLETEGSDGFPRLELADEDPSKPWCLHGPRGTQALGMLASRLPGSVGDSRARSKKHVETTQEGLGCRLSSPRPGDREADHPSRPNLMLWPEIPPLGTQVFSRAAPRPCLYMVTSQPQTPAPRADTAQDSAEQEEGPRRANRS